MVPGVAVACSITCGARRVAVACSITCGARRVAVACSMTCVARRVAVACPIKLVVPEGCKNNLFLYINSCLKQCCS